MQTSMIIQTNNQAKYNTPETFVCQILALVPNKCVSKADYLKEEMKKNRLI